MSASELDKRIRDLEAQLKEARALRRQAKAAVRRPREKNKVIVIDDGLNDIDSSLFTNAPIQIPKAPPLRKPAEERRRLRQIIAEMNEEVLEAQRMNKMPHAQRLKIRMEKLERGLDALIQKHHLEPVIEQGCPNFEELRQKIHESLRGDPPQADFSGLELATPNQIRIIESDIKDFFENEWGNRHVEKKLKLCCRLYSSTNQRFWRSFPLSPFVYKHLIKNLNDHGFLIHFEEASDWESDQASRPLPEWSEMKEMKILPIREKPDAEVRYNIREGGFFPYLLRPDIHSRPLLETLEKCQIFQDVRGNETKLMDSCWVWAHKNAGVPSNIIDALTIRVETTQDAHLKIDEALALSREQGINVIIHYYDDAARQSRVPPACKKSALENPTQTLEINCYKGHYFLEFRTTLTKDYVDALLQGEEVEDKYHAHRKKQGKWNYDRTKPCLPSGKLIKYLFDNGGFVPMMYHHYAALPTVKTPAVSTFLNLSYNPEYCITTIRQQEAKQIARNNQRAAIMKSMNKFDTSQAKPLFFGDTEADPIGEKYHRPYMFCIQSADGSIQKTFSGKRCIEDGLNFLPNNSIVFFHNLGYDVNFFARFGAYGTGILKGKKTYSMMLKYGDKNIVLKDSNAIIPAALAKFPKMFHLEEQQKEVFPYKYYTIERFETNVGTISEAIQYIHKGDEEQFKKNIDKIPHCRIDEDHFDMKVYCEFYCQQDVNLLRRGYMKFRESTQKLFGIDTLNILTAPSLAHKVFVDSVYRNPSIKLLSGLPSEFIRQAIHGGRCMTRRNMKWKTNCRMLDFDARSLYPSAMARLSIPLGPPKVIPDMKPEELKPFLDTKDCYVIQVEFQPVERHRDFPLFVIEDEQGNNLNTDTFTEPITMYLTKIGFEDILEYYDNVKYRILRGYFWDEGVDTKIREVITGIYEQRQKYQEEKNPLQEILKLIMNSAYGKTIQKFIETEIKFLPETEADNFWRRYYNRLEEEVILDGSTIHKMVVRCPTNNQFTLCIVGALVLDMSKRIMNEVMCLAEDIGCRIYYQDTDSMHIREEDLPKLKEAFKEKYKRDLIGPKLGQFHNDFDPKKLDKESTVARRSIFIGKKIYVDELIDKDEKEVEYHIRCKGVRKEGILEKAEEYGGVMKLYEALYQGDQAISFNLLAGDKPSFIIGGDFTIESRRVFERKIKATLPEATVE